MAPLCHAAKFDPFLSLDCAPALHLGAIQGKEGIRFGHLSTLASITLDRSELAMECFGPSVTCNWADVNLAALGSDSLSIVGIPFSREADGVYKVGRSAVLQDRF